MRSDKESIPVWQEKQHKKPSFPILTENLRADVCVVGAGIAGLTTAYNLQKEGKSVVVVDAYGLAAGESGRTTAHLTAVLDDRFYHLETLFGEPGSRHAAESHMAAINRIEAITIEERIDCDFERVPGYLVALTGKQQEQFEKEREAAKRASFADMEMLSQVPQPGVNNVGPALYFPQQATFHPTNYFIGLAEAFQRLGGRIYGGAHVREVKGGARAYVKTDDGLRVDADFIVVATNTPINDWVKMHTKQAAYRTYVVGFEVPKGSFQSFLLWDMEDPYHYVRLVRGHINDFLIVGGEDHKTGQAYDMAARYRELQVWAKRYFAPLGQVKYRWSGQIIEPVDSLAFIGKNPGDDNVYIATGDSGNGMTHGTIAGILITDLIQGRDNPWKDLYDPSRKSLLSVGEYVKENSNVVGHMIGDRIRPSEVNDMAALRPGEGAILQHGAGKVAAFRDMDGQVHACSAVCTHLGCIVQWNPGEKSWDCPCHGSRFDTDGTILNGPAIRPLAKVDVAASPMRKQRMAEEA